MTQRVETRTSPLLITSHLLVNPRGLPQDPRVQTQLSNKSDQSLQVFRKAGPAEGTPSDYSVTANPLIQRNGAGDDLIVDSELAGDLVDLVEVADLVREVN